LWNEIFNWIINMIEKSQLQLSFHQLADELLRG